MWRVTWRGLVARRVRLGLTGIAIALGVAFTSGVLVTIDTLQVAYRGLFDEVVSGVDLVVRDPTEFGGSATPRARVPSALADAVADVEGVARTEGVVQSYAQFVDRDGTPIQRGPVLTLGLSWPELGPDGPFHAVEGRPPTDAREVAMDLTTARDHGFAVGDDVQVVVNGPARWFEIVGLFQIGASDDLGGVTAAAFDRATAQELFGAPMQYDAIYVVVDDGTDATEVADRIRAEVGGYDVTPALEFADQTGAPVRIALELVQYALLGFAGIGLVVGSFIIFNTFSILVSQRVRELGMLRALGASPAQVWRSVLGEAALLGLVGAAVGLGLGVLASRVLLSVLPALGFVVPDTALVVTGRTVLAALAVGVIVTVLAATIPARRAARTAPVEAIADATRRPVRSLVGRSLAGGVVAVVAAGLAAIGLTRAPTEVVTGVILVTVGSALGLLALVVLGPVVVRAVVGALSLPLADVLGVLGRLARANARRNPRRTAATALALVTGVALVTMSVVFVHSFRTSLRAGLADGVRADLVLSGEQFRGFSPEIVTELLTLPEVRAASGVRFADARVDGTVQRIAAMNPVGITEVVDLDVLAGDPNALGPTTVLLHEDTVPGAQVGDEVVVEIPGLGGALRTVSAVYGNRGFAGLVPIGVIIDQDTFGLAFPGTQRDTYAFVTTEGDPEVARAAVAAVLADYPNVLLLTPAEYLALQEEPIDIVSGVLVALLVLSVVIALLGVTNTLLLTVFERTREIGLLRAVGMSRAQVRSMVRAESLLIAAAGGALGLALGLVWAGLLVRALATQGLQTFSVPVVPLAALAVGGLVAGVVAALGPARRAARLDVLAAISEE